MTKPDRRSSLTRTYNENNYKVSLRTCSGPSVIGANWHSISIASRLIPSIREKSLERGSRSFKKWSTTLRNACDEISLRIPTWDKSLSMKFCGGPEPNQWEDATRPLNGSNGTDWFAKTNLINSRGDEQKKSRSAVAHKLRCTVKLIKTKAAVQSQSDPFKSISGDCIHSGRTKHSLATHLSEIRMLCSRCLD